jgi:hypothetical protein
VKSIIKTIFGVLLLCMSAACKKDYLDKAPDDDLTLEKVFANRDYAMNFLSNVYTALPVERRMVDNDPNGNPFVGASDDMEQMYSLSFSNSLNAGSWGPTTYTIDPWTANYVGIRKANLFIENVDKVPLDDFFTSELRSKLKGEALFLRAYFHFLLMRVYGAVPISDHSVAFTDDLKAIRRDPVDKCAAFVAAECDKAAALLPPNITNATDYGRPTKAVCLALKARVLLYMASPLWNGNPDYKDIKNDDGARLFPDGDAGRWQAAADAAKACIDQSESAGYGLYRSASNDPVKNYQEIFYVNNNKEVLFANNAGLFNDNDVYSDPRSTYAGFTLNSITQNVVDDYEMADGTRPILGYNPDYTPIINPASSYTETGFAAADDPKGNYTAGTSNMYVNREPRFYASIHFSGQPWKNSAGLQFWYKGVDGKLAAGAGNYTKTGYLPKKCSDPSFTWVPKHEVLRTWILFRLGEQYLNYAEALNEAQGPVGDVYKYVNLIRDRSGLPGLPTGLSKDDMRERIRHERRIELFYEAHRYFDAHRWKIAEQTEGGAILGLNIFAGDTKTDPAFFQRVLVEKRVFEKKHYLWPMQQRERDKNPNLVQNYGW